MSVGGLSQCEGYVSGRAASMSGQCQCEGYVSERVISVSGLCHCEGYVSERTLRSVQFDSFLLLFISSTLDFAEYESCPFAVF